MLHFPLDSFGDRVLHADRQTPRQIVEVHLGGLSVQVPRPLDVRAAPDCSTRHNPCEPLSHRQVFTRVLIQVKCSSSTS